MKTKLLLGFAVAGMLLVSCGSSEGWTEEDKEEFVGACTDSFIDSFESTMGVEGMAQIDRAKLEEMADNVCNCSYESIKKDYASAEEANKESVDKLMESATNCEPTEEQVMDLIIQ